MRKSATLGVVLVSLIMIGCSNYALPTSPTTTAVVEASSTGTGAFSASLRWDLTASGCDPVRPAPVPAGEPTAVRELAEYEMHYRPGAVLPQWMREADTLWAIFHAVPAGHALCFWDTAGM
jgi:hypothetical protein